MPVPRSTLIAALFLGAVTLAARGTGPDSAQIPPPSFPDIQILIDSGRAAAAVDALDRLTDGDASTALERTLLKARALENAGRLEGAATEWARVSTIEPGLSALARRHGVGLLVAARKPNEAEKLLRTVAGPIDADAELVLTVGDAYRRGGDAAASLPLYQHVLQRQQEGALADRARMGTAEAVEAQGRKSEALIVWTEAMTRFRTASTYTTSRTKVERLSTELGRPVVLDEATLRALTSRLANASRFAEALTALNEWKAQYPESSARDDIDADIVESLYNLRRNRDAREAAEAFLRSHPASPLVGQMRLTIFRLAVREGETERAIALGRELFDAPLPLPVRTSALSLLANYLVGVGRAKEGLDAFGELFLATTAAGDKRTILLREGVAAIRAGRPERALEHLRRLQKLGPQGDAAPAAQFLVGMALEASNDEAGAIDAFGALLVEQPFGYYGLRAAARLDELAARGDAAAARVRRTRESRPPTLTFPALDAPKEGSQPPELRLALLLSRVGLHVDAAPFYRRVAARERGSAAISLLAARAAAAANEHRAAVTLVNQHFGPYLSQGSADAPGDLWTLAYPRPFWSDVRGAADAARIDPLLLAALMRRESRFEASARSAVGALGLFQIMPYTAAEIGPALGLDVKTEERVLQPAVNAAIAASLVARLHRLFGTALSPLIASYNAGEDRVGDWWRASRDVPDDLFVELIPYAETRGFVREVYTNYQTYRRVYANGN
ncbi:MAG: transglycosylase SLT domain-containing protein [Vicinamibacterales bacterium]